MTDSRTNPSEIHVGSPEADLSQFPPTCFVDNVEYKIEAGIIVSDNRSSYSFAILSNSGKPLLLGYSPHLHRYHGLGISDVEKILCSMRELLPDHKTVSFLEDLAGELPYSSSLNKEKTTVLSLPRVNVVTEDCSHEVQTAIQVAVNEDSCIDYSHAAYVFEQGYARGVVAIDRNSISSFGISSSHSCLMLSWSREGVIYEAGGCLVRGRRDGEMIVAEIGAVQLELMQRNTLGDLYTSEIDPVELIKYLMQTKDFGITGIKGPFASNQAERLFVVSAIAQNLESNDNGFVLGDIRFNLPIETCEEFQSRLEEHAGMWTLVWTIQQANDFAGAQQHALARMRVAASQIELFSNRDQLQGALSFGDEIDKWDHAEKPKQIVVGAPIYIEDCESGACVVFGGGDIEERSLISVSPALVKYIEQQWVQDLCEIRASGKRHYLIDATRWLSKAMMESSREDQIISLNTALEYCVVQEQGDTVLSEIVKEHQVEVPDLDEYERQFWADAFSTLSLNLPIQDDRLRRMAENRLVGILKSATGRSSFKSRLGRMIETLDNPISDEDVSLLKKVNSIRNKLLHGKETTLLNTVEMEQAIRAASIVVIAKMKSLGEEK